MHLTTRVYGMVLVCYNTTLLHKIVPNYTGRLWVQGHVYCMALGSFKIRSSNHPVLQQITPLSYTKTSPSSILQARSILLTPLIYIPAMFSSNNQLQMFSTQMTNIAVMGDISIFGFEAISELRRVILHHWGEPE